MCWSKNSKTLSWLGILWGLLSLATLLTAFLSNVWLYTKEPIRFPNSDTLTTVTFKIGLWRICPTLKLTNTTPHTPHLSCTSIKYSSWEDITAADLGMWTPLEFTPPFLSKMRISTFFGAASIFLVFVATAFAVFGVFNSDHKTVLACGLFILGGLTLGGGLLIFASVLSDAYFERPKRSNVMAFEKVPSSGLFDYKYGWSFFAAGAAFFMTELAAVLSISAYVRRFPTVEDMVRIMVPGAERRLKQHHGVAGEYLVERKNKYQRQDLDSSVSLTSGSKSKSSTLKEIDLGGVEGVEAVEGSVFLSKPAPDICTSNPTGPPESIISFGSPPAPSSVLVPPSATYCSNPDNFILSEIGGADSVLSNSPLRGPLAGHTVPIVLMHHSQRPPGTPFTLSASNKDCRRNFKMSAIPLNENTVTFPSGHLLSNSDGEMCFDQNFYSNQCSEFEERVSGVSYNLEHMNSDMGESDVRFFGTFQGERTFNPSGMSDRSSDILGTFSTTSSSSGTGSGTTMTADSSQSGLSRKRDFGNDRKRGKSVTIGNVFSNMETFESGENGASFL